MNKMNMKRILINIKSIEKVVFNIRNDKATLMIVNERHEKIFGFECSDETGPVTSEQQQHVEEAYKSICMALLKGREYVEIETWK